VSLTRITGGKDYSLTDSKWGIFIIIRIWSVRGREGEKIHLEFLTTNLTVLLVF
jgi:hypothetical protein